MAGGLSRAQLNAITSPLQDLMITLAQAQYKFCLKGVQSFSLQSRSVPLDTYTGTMFCDRFAGLPPPLISFTYRRLLFDKLY